MPSIDRNDIPENLVNGVNSLTDKMESYFDKYQEMRDDYPPNVRYTMILETFLSLFENGYGNFTNGFGNDLVDTYLNMAKQVLGDDFCNVLLPKSYDLVRQEIKEMIVYINERKEMEERMLNLEKKMDMILLGPDYTEGRRMMNDAKDDFASHQ